MQYIHLKDQKVYFELLDSAIPKENSTQQAIFLKIL